MRGKPSRVLPNGGANRSFSNQRRILANGTSAQPRVQAPLLAILVVVIGLCPAALPVWAQESSEIAKQAQNLIASMISVPFENDFNPQTGINKENSYVLEMKPVVPFNLSNDWNLITRTIIPVIQVPGHLRHDGFLSTLGTSAELTGNRARLPD